MSTSGYVHADNFDLAQMMWQGRNLPLRERVRHTAATLGAVVTGMRGFYFRRVQLPVGAQSDVLDVETGQIKKMLMFGSNNYLGLADHPYIREAVKKAVDAYGVGAGGAPFFNGHTNRVVELEQRLAATKGAEAAMLFSNGGYGANVGLLSALVTQQDFVVCDERSHSSFFDGLKLAHARYLAFRHNDIDEMEHLLSDEPVRSARDRFVGVEGVYSMEGDHAPLERVVAVCRRQGALLLVDDIHGNGVLGEGGRGTASHCGADTSQDLTVANFSTIFGLSGGYVYGPKDLVDYVRFFARSYMFCVSVPPVTIGAVMAGLDLLEREGWRREKLRENVRYAVGGLTRLGFAVHAPAAIIMLPLPAGIDVRQAARSFDAAGIFVNPIMFPAVPVEQPRFRISVSAAHERGDIDRLLEVVGDVLVRKPVARPARKTSDACEQG